MHLAVLLNIKPVEIQAEVCWLILEYLDGIDMDRIVHPYKLESSKHICSQDHTINIITEDQPIDDIECIIVARCVLAALKVMHAEGLVHRDVKPANIVCCQGPDGKSHKLIDFGSTVGVDELVAKENMMTLLESSIVAVGTPPYMSPEMFKEPETASYPTDIWSLGVTMFELVTAHFPFLCEGELLWGLTVAGNMEEKAPDVLDTLPESRRSTFDHNLSRVIAKALQKKVEERYESADEMHEAVYACLIEREEACYSVFISYRVASEAPHARLLFDELNHSITPGGHRVTVYWDVRRLVKGEDWEAGFASGLLNSLCFVPLLSYGFTAPLAMLPDDSDLRAQAIMKGWEEFPLGRTRLTGTEADSEDNCLKELMIATALLEKSKSSIKTNDKRAAKLQIAYPLLVGRQQPAGHQDYPQMGNFFSVQGGGGQFSSSPSPSTARSVGNFLLNKACFDAEAVGRMELMSVNNAVNAFTRLQGCQLWNHSSVCMTVCSYVETKFTLS